MFRVLVSDSMSREGLAPLLADGDVELVEKTVDQAADELDTFDAIVVRSATKVTAEVMDSMPRLKIIGRAGVGVDNIDLDAATARGIQVVNAPAGNTIATCEHTFAMMAALARGLCRANASTKAGKWERKSFMGMELCGKRLGIIGLGRIGSELAKRARAFAMTVLVHDPYLDAARAEELHVESVTFDELLAQADVITVHAPLTKDTQGMLNRETLAQTKPGVLIINCARGGIVDEAALQYYLEQGHIGGAALDVFTEEPPQNIQLLQLDNVIVTPHIAASTNEAQLNVGIQVAKEVLAFAAGRPVQNPVNTLTT